MAKRGPQSELNDRNWDDEEEVEEAGVFKQATKEALQERVIKKAKRRGQEEGGVKTGAFGGFGGLVSKQPSTASPLSSFAFGGKTTDVKAPSNTGTKASSLTSESGSFFTGGATSSVDNNIESASNKNETSSSKDNSAYLHALKSLNESVLSWIKQHVDKNPYIILTPIFKDYEKYLASLESKKATGATNGSSSILAFSSSSSGIGSKNNNNGSEVKAATATTFSAFAPKSLSGDADLKKEGKEEDKAKDVPAKATTFSFGSTSSSSNGEGIKFSTSPVSTTTSGFSFGQASTSISSGFSFGQQSSSTSSTLTGTTTAATGFSFGSSSSSTSTAAATTSFGASGFSFGNLAAKAASDNAQSGSQDVGNEDEYVPPKPEVKEVKEEGSLFSKRCKLFYQKEGQWVERGVGNIHVKPLDETKTQLLVRADTNLGNILLNINLTSGLPASRQGKNNVLLVCVPNPPLKDGSTEPIPMLVRVKTAEEADELLAKLEERKALL